MRKVVICMAESWSKLKRAKYWHMIMRALTQHSIDALYYSIVKIRIEVEGLKSTNDSFKVAILC